MFRNHIIISLRNLVKNRLNSAVSILGLAVGIAASIVMFLYAMNVLTYNSNHKHADRIYMVYKERHLPTGIQITRDTWFPMANSLQQKYPAIEEATHLWNQDDWVQTGNQKFKISVTYAMQNIFDVFSFPLRIGDKSDFVKNNYTAVISEQTAEKLFGRDNPIGKTITVNYNTDYVVRGVLENIPKNSTYRPDIMVPSNSVPWYGNVQNFWGSSWLDTYVMLRNGTDIRTFENQLQTFVRNNMSEESSAHLKLRLTALPDLYNETTHANTYAYILLALAFVVLMIASINFMNLATANSIKRMKEIGVQKVLGASRRDLILRYLSESLLVSFLSLILGVILAEMFLPLFNQIYEMDLSLWAHDWVQIVTGLLSLGLITGFLSGIYPAVLLTRHHPVELFAGRFRDRKHRLNLRSGLIVLQFVLAIVLFIGTGMVLHQIDFMKNANLNVNTSNLVVISASASDFSDKEAATQRLETFKSELESYSGITGVTSSSMSIPAEGGGHVFVYPDDRPEVQRLRERWAVVDDNFFNVYGIKLLDGRNFSSELATDRENAVIVNEAALKDIGWDSIHDGKIRAGGKDRTIIGLVQDYNYQSLESGIEPMIHIYRPSESTAHNYITVRIAPGKVTAALDYIREKWRAVDPARPVPFRFVDDSFNRLYATQDRLASVAQTFTGVALVISCLGLFALTALMLTYRTKEIGVRKVLGASVSGITFMLAKDFTKWVLVASIIAIPVAYYFMHHWLQNFAYHTGFDWWIVIYSCGIALIAALVTVCIQTVKSALANPLEALRYE